AISVKMFVERFTIEAQPRWKNGHPPHKTTGVAKISSIQGSQPFGKMCRPGTPGSMSDMAIASKGAVGARLTQKRRVMSRNSGFSSSWAVAVRGSSAMPQMGQLPGPGRTISGCMGQVYSTRVAADGISGSRAMPQRGHALGSVARTTGHMGQTYAVFFSGAAAPDD